MTMLDDYHESELIEKSAIELFESLGYSYQNCYHETFGARGTLGCETSSEVVLVPQLVAALKRLNPAAKRTVSITRKEK